jgi:hypothetical protein
MKDKSSLGDHRLVEAVQSTLEWVKQSRPPRGGATSKRKVERLLQKSLAQLERSRLVTDEIRSNLQNALGKFAEYYCKRFL